MGLAGFGTVGGGLARLLEENADIIRQRTGRDIRVKKVLVRNAQKARTVPLPPGADLTTDPDELVNDPEIDVLVELMGGIDAPRAIIDRALDAGKHIVTANKALLAEEGLALFQKAAGKGRILRYEASVAGAVPVVEALRTSLAGNRISSLMGILNGTSNYILSEMTSNGLDFDVALKQAQQLGYAEADPTLDIDGHDAAHKLTLLIRLAYAVRVSGNACGSLFFHGRGAGDLPTAGAVLADLMAVARDENPHNTGYACDDLPRASIVPPAEWRSRYYVRVMVEDEPGVLRDLAGCMADQGVSMAQVIQRTDEGKGVPLVFMTHETTEEAMSTALQRTLDTGMLRQPAVYFRVLD